MVDISLIFRAGTISKGVAEFLKIVESTNTKIDRLSKAKFDAAMRSLDEIHFSENPENQREFLLDARRLFLEALTLEKTDRLAHCYVGLAKCHYYLDEHENCKRYLKTLSEKDFVIFPVRVAMEFTQGFLGDNVWELMNGLFGTHIQVDKIKTAYDLKKSAKHCLKEFFNTDHV